MVRFGVDQFPDTFPDEIKGKKPGIVCHSESASANVFKDLPNEYEHYKMLFDSQSVSDSPCHALINNDSLSETFSSWNKEDLSYRETFTAISHYPKGRE